jgi:hypothetical protein
MADYTIASDQVGVYEIPLTAGNVTTVTVKGQGYYITSSVQISVHDASMPVYARLGDNVTVKDPAASVVTTGTWLNITTGSGDDATVSIISAADATISVARA